MGKFFLNPRFSITFNLKKSPSYLINFNYSGYKGIFENDTKI